MIWPLFLLCLQQSGIFRLVEFKTAAHMRLSTGDFLPCFAFGRLAAAKQNMATASEEAKYMAEELER